MRNATVLFIILVFIILGSCQKGIEPGTPTTPSLTRIKTYTEDVTGAGSGHNVITFNLSYDANNRLISLVSAASPGDRFQYQYSAASFTMDLYNSNVLSIHEIFFLNNNSFVDSTFQYNDTNDSTTEKYEYNNVKQLIKLTEYSYSKVTGTTIDNISNYTYDANGNVIKVTDFNYTTTYDYTTIPTNNFSIGVPYVPVPKFFVKTTTADDGSSVVVFNHSYTFDSSNRLSTETVIGDNGESAIKSYTY